MPSESLSTANYAAVIKDLRAKRDELNRTIAMLEAMANIPATQAQAPAVQRQPAIATNTGIGDACAKILEHARGTMTTNEVFAALTANGFEFNTQNPVNNVWSALNHRTKVAGDVRKAGRGRWRYVAPTMEKPATPQFEMPQQNGLAAHE